MAGIEANSGVLALDNPLTDREKWPQAMRRKFRDGASSKKLVRVNWLTLVDLDPETVPWAESGQDDLQRTGRAAVVRAGNTVMAKAGAFEEEAYQVVIREWDGRVQMSTGNVADLFRWQKSHFSFDIGVFAESNEGRVGLAIRHNLSRLVIPEGAQLLGQLPPKEMPEDFPGVRLAG